MNFLVANLQSSSSADFQAAVSQASGLLGARWDPGIGRSGAIRSPAAPADWKSAIQQTRGLRYRAALYRPCPRGRCHAFTLIEMMVVLVLIGIVSAMILLEMKGTYSDALLRSSARDLINVFSIAGSRAISLNQLHLVRISAATGRYEIERQVQVPGKRAEFAPLKDVADSSGKLDERISVKLRKPNENQPGKAGAEQTAAPNDDPDLSLPPGAIAFYPDGTAEAADVVLHDRAGFGLRLRISPITARVQIQALSPEQSDEGDETTDEHNAAERQSDETPQSTMDEHR